MIRAPALPALARLRRQLVVCATIALTAVTPTLQTATAQSQPPSLSLIRDTEIEAILREDADPIFIAAGLNPKDVTIHLVGAKDLNAFVTGGQHLFLHTGLIIQTKNPNELMGVIAHETGHIAGGHIARQGEANRGAMATYFLTMGLGILAAMASRSETSGEAAMGLFYSAEYFATLNILGYTRQQESSADLGAARYMEKAGISGKGLVSFFNNFAYQEMFSDARRDAYFRSHPLSQDRITALSSRVEAASHYNDVDSPAAMARHKIMVAKLRAFINFPQQTFQDYPETDVSFPARYARAIAFYKDLDTGRAIRETDALLLEQPDNAFLWELKGQILFEAGKSADSVAPHGRSVELAPNAPLLRINYAQSLLAVGRPGDALAQLDRAITLESGENPFAWQLAARAYESAGQPGLARLASAEMNFALGQIPQARSFALRARELLPKESTGWRKANDIINISEAVFEQMRGRRGPG